VTSLRYITTVVSSLLGSQCPVVLIFIYILTRRPISRGELAGTSLAVAGVCLCVGASIIAPTETRDVDNNDLLESGPLAFVFGCLLASMCSVLSAAETLATVRVRKYVPLFIWLLYNLAIVTTTCVVFTLAIEGSTLTGSGTGAVFGFLTREFLPTVMFLGFLGGLVGLVGFKYSILYISPLVHTVVPLLDPMLTGVISYGLGYEGAPTWPVFLGGAIIIGGIITLVAGEEFRNKKRAWYLAALAQRAEAKLLAEGLVPSMSDSSSSSSSSSSNGSNDATAAAA
jgi:drug/metabolite transporter (DMT)-like permease